MNTQKNTSDVEEYPNASELTQQVLGIWRQVLARRAPEVARHFQSPFTSPPAGKQAIPFLQALNIRYQLLRIVDENEAMRQRRTVESERGEAAVPDSFASLLSEKYDRDAVASMASSVTVGPTITAHPTETKRVTVLEIHRRIYRGLVMLETDRWTPRERHKWIDGIRAEVDLLWLTGELRIDRPTPEDEIGWGLHFFSDIMFEAVPQVCDSLNRVVSVDPDKEEVIPKLQFHSWIGGDRDGNPHVTARVTRHALDEGRKTVMARYDAVLHEAASQLSISDLITPLSEAQSASLKNIISNGPAAFRNTNEIFRQAMSAIRHCLQEEKYHHVSDFIADIKTVEDCLIATDSTLLVNRYIRPIRWLAEIFGFRTVTLDIRQNSTVCNATLKEVWEQINAGTAAPVYGSEQWSQRLSDELASDKLPALNITLLSDQGKELFDLLILMREHLEGPDPRSIGPFILSMTQSPDDLAAVLLLARYAGFDREAPELRVVPLFETIEDLRGAPDIMRQFLEIPIARRCLTRRSFSGNDQAVEIMLGYSDSNKDGGFLCSNWEVHCAQTSIVSAMDSLGLQTSFFHGRGGSVSRGGAPTQRAIEAQPPGTIGQRIRITEQGEVVSARYANRGSAAAHLELLMSSALSHRLKKPSRQSNPEYEDSMAALSGLSQTTYTSLVNSEGFLDYFQEASPVEELASLKIGSRPAKRFGANTLDDLRAIPWVFAWTQNRHLITGWFGFGSAVENLISIRGESGLTLLRNMFERSEFFRLVVDETEKTLFQTDLEIAREYASLVTDDTTRESIFKKITDEREKTAEAVRLITGNDSLAQRFPDFRYQFDRYARDLDRVHLLQIDLLREARAQDNNTTVSIPLLQSMHCISSALGWTG